MRPAGLYITDTWFLQHPATCNVLLPWAHAASGLCGSPRLRRGEAVLALVKREVAACPPVNNWTMPRRAWRILPGLPRQPLALKVTSALGARYAGAPCAGRAFPSATFLQP